MYSAFCLYGTAGPKSQEFWRKAANTGFGKHSKIRWCTKVVKWHSWGTEHSSTMPITLEKTEERWRNVCRRNGEGVTSSLSLLSDSVCLRFSPQALNARVRKSKVNWQLLIINNVPCTGMKSQKHHTTGHTVLSHTII